MNRTLIVGATSAIAESFARLIAARGASLYLLGRDEERLAAIASDLALRGAGAVSHDILDVNAFDAHESALEKAHQKLGGFDLVLVAHGTLSDQLACEQSVERTMHELSTNALSVVALTLRIAQRLEYKERGTLVVISSVAGDRGRRSNYVYGSAKALVTTFMSGLRQRMYGRGINVITVKPGFVDTPMTASFRKGPLWSNPSEVAAGILRAVDRGRSVVYVPWFWRPLMLVVRCVPESVFKRLVL